MPLASFVAQFFVPSVKIPVDIRTFVSYVLPPVICYFVLAVLAVTPQTHAARVALWPFFAMLALRATLSVDMSHSMPEYTFLDTILLFFMFSCVTYSFGWTLSKRPLVRHLRPRNSPSSIIVDALDLVSTFRGHGWDWSGRLYVPRETRPTNRIAFVSYALLSAVVHAIICGVFHRAVLSLIPERVGSTRQGSTLFDATLPFLVQYLRASIITIFIAIATYAVMQTAYDLLTITGVLFLGQDPAQWPPAFDAPWRATSLTDFWGRRWHQFSRRLFLLIGGYPLSLVLGRTGIVVGAFLASALWHHVNLLMLDHDAELWWMFVGFGMMAPGILAERAFRRFTGRRVGGVTGWIWTMVWLVLWGNVIFEGFARAPMHDRLSLIDVVPPVRVLVERLVMDLDDWLHTL